MDISDDSWDYLMAELGGHFLQGSTWRRFQLALGREVISSLPTETWMWQAVMMSGKGFKHCYAPYGPVVKSNLTGAIANLVEIAGGYDVDFVRIEPTGQVEPQKLMALGARRSAPIQPSQTQIIDLTKSEEELRQDLSSGHRNAINAAERRGLSFRSTRDPGEIETFLTMLKATASRAGIRPHPDNYYQVMAESMMPTGEMRLHLAEHQGKPVAAAISFEGHGTDYYAHAAAFPEARELQAAVPLVWQMITGAKDGGQSRFDLYGIAPTDDPKHPWAGFTRFKQAFGGSRLDYAGTWEIPVRRLRYTVYRLAKQVVR